MLKKRDVLCTTKRKTHPICKTSTLCLTVSPPPNCFSWFVSHFFVLNFFSPSECFPLSLVSYFCPFFFFVMSRSSDIVFSVIGHCLFLYTWDCQDHPEIEKNNHSVDHLLVLLWFIGTWVNLVWTKLRDYAISRTKEVSSWYTSHDLGDSLSV